MKSIMYSVVLMCLIIPGVSSAREPLTDHPLTSPYEGSTIKRKSIQEFDVE